MATIINCEEARAVAKSQREDGRNKLRVFLDWEDFDEEQDMRKSALLDCLYDTLTVLVDRGLPWPHVCRLFTLACNLLKQSRGISLTEAISLLRQQSEACLPDVSPQNMQVFTDHFFTTFLKHYKLYQYVMCEDREKLFANVKLLVETPTDPQHFTEGKPISVWEYEQKYEAIEEAGQQKQVERLRRRQEEAQQDSERLREAKEKLENAHTLREKEVLEQLIEQVAAAHICSASHAIQFNVTDTCEKVDLLLKQSALPRPQALGPPPRHQTQTPLSSSSKAQLAPSRSKSRSSRSGSRQSARSARQVK